MLALGRKEYPTVFFYPELHAEPLQAFNALPKTGLWRAGRTHVTAPAGGQKQPPRRARRPTRARQAAAAFPLLILSLPGPAGRDHPSMGRPSSPPLAEIRSPLWSLPEELLLLICSYLDARALGRLGQTCRRLFRFTCRDVLWRRLARFCLNAGFSALGADL